MENDNLNTIFNGISAVGTLLIGIAGIYLARWQNKIAEKQQQQEVLIGKMNIFQKVCNIITEYPKSKKDAGDKKDELLKLQKSFKLLFGEEQNSCFWGLIELLHKLQSLPSDTDVIMAPEREFEHENCYFKYPTLLSPEYENIKRKAFND